MNEAENISTAKEAASFVGFRYLSNALWLGGTALGVYAERKLGLSPLVVCPTIATGVAGVEYMGSGKAVEIFTLDSANSQVEAEENDQDTINRGKIIRELGSFGYACWAGAMSAVKVNDTLGLESTKKRRIIQSATYGTAVSLWASSVPGFKQAQNVTISTAELAINNPLETLGAGAVGSLLLYGVLRGVQKIKNRFKKAHFDEQS